MNLELEEDESTGRRAEAVLSGEMHRRVSYDGGLLVGCSANTIPEYYTEDYFLLDVEEPRSSGWEGIWKSIRKCASLRLGKLNHDYLVLRKESCLNRQTYNQVISHWVAAWDSARVQAQASLSMAVVDTRPRHLLHLDNLQPNPDRRFHSPRLFP